MAPRKRKAAADPDMPAQEEGLTQYELYRAEIMARNRARLLALGIPDAVKGLQSLIASTRPKPSAPRRPRRAGDAPPTAPSRKSARLVAREMEAAGHLPPDVEPASELAQLIIDGECPRCGRAVRSGQRQHLAACVGPPAPPSEEEVAAEAEELRNVEKQRLRELEMGGLVDFVRGPPAVATFVIIGSTGSHYSVRLAEPGALEGGQQKARSCTCLDHRFRRHDCKHIKLLLQQLGVADAAQQWPQALERQVGQLQPADAADAAMVRAADARAAARKRKQQVESGDNAA